MTLDRKGSEQLDPVQALREALQDDPKWATFVWHDQDAIPGEFKCHNTILHLLADRMYGDPHCVELAALVLEHGADPNARNDFGWTPLHFACAIDGRDKTMVKLLLHNGADPNVTDSTGQMPLHYALGASEESKQIVALLLQHGANVDLDAAARLGDFQTVRRLLGQGGLSQSRTPRDLLTNAIHSGSAWTVEALLKHGADPNQTPSFSRVPPLYTASDPLWSKVEIVRLLLEHGANPNPKRYKPLVVARRNPANPAVIELLNYWCSRVNNSLGKGTRMPDM